MNSDAIQYIVCKLDEGADRNEVLNTLRAAGQGEYFEAYTKAEFSKKSQDYWLNSTGAGFALAMAAVMGLVVGVVVAGQVLYTSTLEHIKEYGTLKAIGATNGQVSCAIMAQAVVGAVPAHCIAGILLLIASKYIGGIIQLSIDFRTYMFLGFMTVLVCIAASMLSVWRVTRVEPAEVFKG
jgi:putative ABC transport system permease protein